MRPTAKRPDWSRPLPRPLVILEVMTLETLADVRKLLGHLPKEVRAKETWQAVAEQLEARRAAPIPPTSPWRCSSC